MGNAAYNRGTKKIRVDIDRQIEESNRTSVFVGARSPQDAALLGEIERLRLELAATTDELTRARDAWEKRGIYLENEREMRREAEREAKQERESMLQWFRAAENYRRSWYKASAMLRTFSPDQVQEARAFCKSQYPDLWAER